MCWSGEEGEVGQDGANYVYHPATGYEYEVMAREDKRYDNLNQTIHRDLSPIKSRAWRIAARKIGETNFTVLFHRIDGPARVTYYSHGQVAMVAFMQFDKIHRIDGPAIIHYDAVGIVTGENWLFNGKVISDQVREALSSGYVIGTPEFNFFLELA